jgi:predicted O-methyltransferase YrrM
MKGQICLNGSVLDFMESKLTDESWVLELGGGYSSRWFADRCRNLTVMETDPKWRRIITQSLTGCKAHCSVRDSLNWVQGFGGVDLVLVDCVENLRFKATQIGWNCLGEGGWLVFDDAQRPRHRESVLWMGRQAGVATRLEWRPGDLENAQERLALAWQKPLH